MSSTEDSASRLMAPPTCTVSREDQSDTGGPSATPPDSTASGVLHQSADMEPWGARTIEYLKHQPRGLHKALDNGTIDIEVEPPSLDEGDVDYWSATGVHRKMFDGTLHYPDGTCATSNFHLTIQANFRLSSELSEAVLLQKAAETTLWRMSSSGLPPKEALAPYLQDFPKGSNDITMYRTTSGTYNSGPWPFGRLTLHGYAVDGKPTLSMEQPVSAFFSIEENPSAAVYWRNVAPQRNLG